MKYKTAKKLERMCLAGTLLSTPTGVFLQSLNQSDHSGTAFYTGVSLSIISLLAGFYFNGLKKDILEDIAGESYSPTMRFFLLEDRLNKYEDGDKEK